jgi:hypothetical protein
MWGGHSWPPLLTFLNSATQYQKIPRNKVSKAAYKRARPTRPNQSKNLTYPMSPP